MQPIIIEDNISIAAGATNNNVIASNPALARYLRAPFRAQGKLVMAQSAAGLVVSLDGGSRNFVAQSHPEVNNNITEPFQLINDQWFVEVGDMLALAAVNPTGGAISLRYRIVLYPVAEMGACRRVIQQGPTSIAAGAVSIQLFAGLRYERPPVDSILTVWMDGSAAGLTRTLDVDTDSISPAAAVIATNRMPRDPDDKCIDGVEAPQDKQLSLAVSNPTGGALNVFWRMALDELVIT